MKKQKKHWNIPVCVFSSAYDLFSVLHLETDNKTRKETK